MELLLAGLLDMSLPHAALAFVAASWWWWADGEWLPIKDIVALFFLLWLIVAMTLPIFHVLAGLPIFDDLSGQEDPIQSFFCTFGTLAIYIVIGRNFVLWRREKQASKDESA